MGIERLPSGKWRARWFDETGKRCSSSFVTEKQALAAERRGFSGRDDVRTGIARPLAQVTLNNVVPTWLAKRTPDRQRDDESRLRTHILPHFGDTPLHKIDGDALERFARHLEQKKVARPGQKTVAQLRPMTVKNCLNLVCKILRDHKFNVRVTYKVQPSGYAWIEQPADVAKFLEACELPWFKMAAALAVYGGLRQGEVAGLRRDAVDFERGLLRVDRSYDGPTKSKHMRWAPLSPGLASMLRPWLLAHPGELVVMREEIDDDGEVKGRMIVEKHGTLAAFTRRACKRAGVQQVTFHQLRHTSASHLAQRIPLSLVGAVLGHADPKTTARYAHLNPESVARDPRLHLDFQMPKGKAAKMARAQRASGA